MREEALRYHDVEILAQSKMRTQTGAQVLAYSFTSFSLAWRFIFLLTGSLSEPLPFKFFDRVSWIKSSRLIYPLPHWALYPSVFLSTPRFRLWLSP